MEPVVVERSTSPSARPAPEELLCYAPQTANNLEVLSVMHSTGRKALGTRFVG